MFKKKLSLVLALVLALGIFTFPALAAEYSWTGTWDVPGSWGTMTLTQNGNNVTGTYTHQQGKISGTVSGNVLSGTWEQPGNNRKGTLEMSMSADGKTFTMKWKYDGDTKWYSESDKGTRTSDLPPSSTTTPPTTGTPVAAQEWNASTWAKPELEKAQSYGLIPDALKGVDYTKPITRAEFAAVSVKLYENLTGKTASPVAANPFKDTNDVEVLKAYNIGLTAGTAADTFSPNTLLNREQAATMLTRAIKASYINGWTLANDNAYTLNFTQPAKFADDAKISDWAKPSVYYANANNIIAGTGNNMFSPADSATREQAIAIACRMVDNLKGKPIDYNGDSTQPPDTTQPPSGNNALVGSWYFHASTLWFHFAFGENGNFAYYVASRATNNSISETYVKGKYRVNGNNVEFYDNQVDSYFGYGSWKYFGNSQHELSEKELLDTSLKDTEKTDNFSMKYEFLDASRLRIILDRDNIRDRYDEVFYRIGTAPDDNTQITTPNLPGLVWPAAELPTDVLEYSGGRVREVDTSRGEVIIMIDNTTREYYISYFNSLIQSGWIDSYEEEFDDFVKGVRSTHWAAGLQKGSYRLSVSWRGDGDVKISYWESRW